jgi:hypothetical protein
VNRFLVGALDEASNRLSNDGCTDNYYDNITETELAWCNLVEKWMNPDDFEPIKLDAKGGAYIPAKWSILSMLEALIKSGAVCVEGKQLDGVPKGTWE